MSGHGDPLSFLSPEALAALDERVRGIVADELAALAANGNGRESDYVTVAEAAELLRASRSGSTTCSRTGA